ncbi:hypothetical protein AC579_5520 [Pseudocercospora musae]|uniref:Urease accessory protein UreD n=1 Tax=Pseudocercospora musae TaxID=113226 RepID=A0A139IMV1_9PEZI|nr:hypothetical protein AC579_5520 [Pseudocercospora musae]
MSSPFSPPSSSPGHGTIHLALLPPNHPKLRTVNYQYPLKLVYPAPVRTTSEDADLVHTVYLLTYGGGLVAGDTIDLHVQLDQTTKLILLTQGSTKLFKSPSRHVLSKQSMRVDLTPGSGLCYLPDPVQPFEKSCFEQQQIYNIHLSSTTRQDTGSLCLLDWVCNDRPANGENWPFYRYGSRSEIYLQNPAGARKLLLRDNMLLDQDEGKQGDIAIRMDGLAVYATLILYGPMFSALGRFIMSEFKHLPRIGGRKWDSGSDTEDEEKPDPLMIRRLNRQRLEAASKVSWSAASIRGCVVVKFAAPALESARRWLHTLLSDESSVTKQFGERALLCLR